MLPQNCQALKHWTILKPKRLDYPEVFRPATKTIYIALYRYVTPICTTALYHFKNFHKKKTKLQLYHFPPIFWSLKKSPSIFFPEAASTWFCFQEATVPCSTCWDRPMAWNPSFSNLRPGRTARCGNPQNEWFISWKTLFKPNGWFGFFFTYFLETAIWVINTVLIWGWFAVWSIPPIFLSKRWSSSWEKTPLSFPNHSMVEGEFDHLVWFQSYWALENGEVGWVFGCRLSRFRCQKSWTTPTANHSSIQLGFRKISQSALSDFPTKQNAVFQPPQY